MRTFAFSIALLVVACDKPASSPPTDGAATAANSAPTTSAPEAAAPSSTPAAPGASIGSATMEKDGTIVLQLRAEGPGPALGDALVRYPKGHKDYDMILRHVGGLTPGESKPCPPFPSEGGH